MKFSLPWKLKRWKDRLKDKWPLTTKKFMDEKIQLRLLDQSQRYERELEETRKAVDSIVERCSKHIWQRDRDRRCYSLRIDFDPVMMGMTGYVRREELEIIAKLFSRRVEAEIATSRFISEVEKNERIR